MTRRDCNNPHEEPSSVVVLREIKQTSTTKKDPLLSPRKPAKGSVPYVVRSFRQLQLYLNTHLPPSSTWIALDLDDTVFASVFRSCRLATPGGLRDLHRALTSPDYPWAASLSESQKKRVLHLYGTHLQRMALTQPDIPYILRCLAERGFSVFGLTTRGPEHMDATVTMLRSLGVEFNHPFPGYPFSLSP